MTVWKCDVCGEELNNEGGYPHRFKATVKMATFNCEFTVDSMIIGSGDHSSDLCRKCRLAIKATVLNAIANHNNNTRQV